MNNSSNGNAAVKKKRSGRFNFIDFLLIIIAILIILTVIYVFAPFSWIKKLTSDQTRNIQYTVEISGVDEAFIDKIKENDVVVDSVSKNNMGTVVAVDSNNKYTELQYIVVENTESGSSTIEGVLSEYPGKYNLIITIYATADYNEGEGYYMNGSRIAVGEKMYLRFPDYVGEGYCIGLTNS